jgi:hypothetical protein
MWKKSKNAEYFQKEICDLHELYLCKEEEEMSESINRHKRKGGTASAHDFFNNECVEDVSAAIKKAAEIWTSCHCNNRLLQRTSFRKPIEPQKNTE